MEDQINYVKRSQRDYSMSLKLQIVSEIEKRNISITQTRKQYGIQSHATVLNWLRKFGNFDWENQTPTQMAKTPEQKIMGYYVAENLSLKALKMALKYIKSNILTLIHHSERGLQYCVNEYQRELIKHKVLCSMTQNSDPYENAVAERINEILKQEFMIDKYRSDLNLFCN